jgi:hypothetical protein
MVHSHELHGFLWLDDVCIFHCKWIINGLVDALFERPLVSDVIPNLYEGFKNLLRLHLGSLSREMLPFIFSTTLRLYQGFSVWSCIINLWFFILVRYFVIWCKSLLCLAHCHFHLWSLALWGMLQGNGWDSCKLYPIIIARNHLHHCQMWKLQHKTTVVACGSYDACWNSWLDWIDRIRIQIDWYLTSNLERTFERNICNGVNQPWTYSWAPDVELCWSTSSVVSCGKDHGFVGLLLLKNKCGANKIFSPWSITNDNANVRRDHYKCQCKHVATINKICIYITRV